MDKPDEGSEGFQELVRRIESSGRPARERGLAEKYSNEGKITTLMLRNIPSKYTQDMLIEELVDCMGSADCFDFFYLPWDQQNDCNLSYAFVNFRSVQATERCTRIFTNFSFRRFDSPKICKVYPAHIQGLENNVLHLMDRAVSDARSHYPVIMWKGEKLKLGKVVAALHGSHSRNSTGMPRVVVPASAPGKFFGNREPPLGPSSHIAGGGMNMEGLDQPWMDAKDSMDWPFGSLQTQRIAAPASVGVPSSLPAASWPPGPLRLGDGGVPTGPSGGLVPPLSGSWPWGPVTAGDNGVPSSPGLGAAGQQLPGPWPPGPAPMAEGVPPRLSAASVAAGLRQCPEGPPPMLGGPPMQSAAGLLQRSSEGSPAAAASMMHAGPGMMQYPMEEPPVSTLPMMQSGQGFTQRLNEAGSNGFQMGTEPDAVRTIGLRNPTDDVLAKFLDSLGT